MIYIYKEQILKYIHLLAPEHIREFAKACDLYVSDEEVSILYKFILENYRELLENENSIVKLKPYIRKDLYYAIEKIYKENKAKNII